MLSLDEAIIHCEEVIEKQRSKAHIYEDAMVHNQTIKHNSEAEYYEELMNECIECAEEYHQFAKWLKELKAYRDERVGCEYCKHNFRKQHERPCSLCKHNFLDMFEREVNADE